MVNPTGSHDSLLQCLDDAGVRLVEWEHTLLIRLGVPLSDNGVSFNWPGCRQFSLFSFCMQHLQLLTLLVPESFLPRARRPTENRP